MSFPHHYIRDFPPFLRLCPLTREDIPHNGSDDLQIWVFGRHRSFQIWVVNLKEQVPVTSTCLTDVQSTLHISCMISYDFMSLMTTRCYNCPLVITKSPNIWAAGTLQKQTGHLLSKRNRSLDIQMFDQPMTYFFWAKSWPIGFEVFQLLKYIGDFVNFISHTISIF